ncbi:GntR family transcriptional regulator [Syntrophaceticus schinkii]|nr:GntR family transcriptional regulator [Syntrophaceticus schinkii]
MASIREAISALAVLGVLEVRRGEGTFINGKFTRDSFNSTKHFNAAG